MHTEHTANRSNGLAWRLALATLLPFILASACLFFTHYWPSNRFTVLSDYVGLGLSVLVGAAFIAMLPLRTHLRILFVIVYVPLVAALLLFYTFWFMVVVFHEIL
jgi:hypothetical protein